MQLLLLGCQPFCDESRELENGVRRIGNTIWCHLMRCDIDTLVMWSTGKIGYDGHGNQSLVESCSHAALVQSVACRKLFTPVQSVACRKLFTAAPVLLVMKWTAIMMDVAIVYFCQLQCVRVSGVLCMCVSLCMRVFGVVVCVWKRVCVVCCVCL